MLFVNKGEVLQNIISISQDSVPVAYNHEDFEEEEGGGGGCGKAATTLENCSSLE